MDREIRSVIIGAGLGGLAAARALHAAGERSFVLLEREPSAGGVWSFWRRTADPG